MFRLLRIELTKSTSYYVFWGMAALNLMALAGLYWGIQPFIDDKLADASRNSPIPIPAISLYNFPEIWHNLSFMAGSRFFLMFPALVIILLVTNEYSFRTIRQNVIDGLSRTEFFLGKLYLSVFIALFLSLFLLINGFLLGIIHSADVSSVAILSKIHFIAAYFLEVLAFCSLAMMIGFLVPKSIFALGILFVYAVIAEPIATHFVGESYKQFFPLYAMSGVIDVPNSSLMKLFGVQFKDYIDWALVLITLGWTVVFNLISLWIVRKKNL
ncbi:MAG: ABC transporter permease subunit [Bacteroidales bacterium]|nr:ABC transporter permease subunit [Bacteroidales bacterium]